VKQQHPAILSVVAPVIEACADVGRLRDWALAAPRMSDAEFVRVVGAEASAGSTGSSRSRSIRGRAPRPTGAVALAQLRRIRFGA
jgi:hypothetical protein